MLKGKNIVLRPLELRDVDNIYQWENNPENWVVSSTTTPFSKFFLEQFVLNSQNNIFTDLQLRLAIEDAAGNLAGVIDLFEFDPLNRRAGVGILIESKMRKQGYASQAIEVICNYARNVLNLHQLYCSIGSDNEVSLKLFEKAGFEVTGKRREWTWRPEEWRDEYFLQKIL